MIFNDICKSLFAFLCNPPKIGTYILLNNQKSCLPRGWHDFLIVSNAVIMQLVMHYATWCSEVRGGIRIINPYGIESVSPGSGAVLEPRSTIIASDSMRTTSIRGV